MSFFGRAANLLKGGVKSLTRPDTEPDRRARALDEELARDAAPRTQPRDAAPVARPSQGATAEPPSKPESAEPAVPERGPPERDALGNVKRTL